MNDVKSGQHVFRRPAREPGDVAFVGGFVGKSLAAHDEAFLEVRCLVGIFLGVDASDPHEPGLPRPLRVNRHLGVQRQLKEAVAPHDGLAKFACGQAVPRQIKKSHIDARLANFLRDVPPLRVGSACHEGRAVDDRQALHRGPLDAEALLASEISVIEIVEAGDIAVFDRLDHFFLHATPRGFIVRRGSLGVITSDRLSAGALS